MATVTSTITDASHASLKLRPSKASSGRLLSPNAPTHYGDFRDDLLRDGFAIVKGAVPRERAEQCGNEMFQFLEEL
jgi:hypothetical protein